MSIKRRYNCKDVDMLLASKTIVQNLKLNISELAVERSNWTEEFATRLENKIDDAIDKYLGLDKKKELRDTTARLTAIQEPALRDLSFIKTQINVDFGKNANNIIKSLGFDKNLRAAQKGDQEALIELLYTFKKEMNHSLKADLIAKGTNPELMQRIINYADQINQTNLTQETLKKTTKDLSIKALNVFNDIYNEVIGICKIASSFYKLNTLKKEQFTFAKVIKNMNETKKINDNVLE